ncbi:unnamed protein product [Agarophyton chilense]
MSALSFAPVPRTDAGALPESPYERAAINLAAMPRETSSLSLCPRINQAREIPATSRSPLPIPSSSEFHTALLVATHAVCAFSSLIEHCLHPANMTTDKYSVLLPTFNERENLPYVIFFLHEAFRQADVNYEVIIVDDSSPDGTLQVAKQLQLSYGADKIILRPRERRAGLGSAYMHGAKYATGNFVIILDADLSHHPKFIPTFIEKQTQTGCDVVTGTRYVPSGGVYGWTLRRKLVSRVANYLAHIVLRPGVSDLTGSFRLYRRNCFDAIMSQMEATGYVFQMEIIVRAKRMGFDVREVPITFVDRLFGESKMGADEIIQYLIQLWRLAWV